LFGTFVLGAVLSAQTVTAPADAVRTVVDRLELEQFKAHIRGLAQFGDRMPDLVPSVSVRETKG
jgi:hypothetical protein